MTIMHATRVIVMSLAGLAPHTWAQSSVWMTHAMDRVSRNRIPETTWEPYISAARGEWEALQLIVSGAPESIHGTLITSTSLRGPEDAVIPAPVILREHYVSISHSSELAALPHGEYPDALVPQLDKWQPLPAADRINQPFWIDVYVPPDAKAGNYQGKLTATLSTGETLEKEFTLHVFGFSLPRLPTLKSSIFMVWRRIAKVHGFNPDDNTAPPALRHILDDYYDMLVEHRLSPHEVWATYPEGPDPLSNESFAHIEAALRHHLLQRQAGLISLPLWPIWPVNDPLGRDRTAALSYAARYYKICEKLGCADRLYKIFGELDEPNDAAKYDQVRQWGKFFEELHQRHGVKIPLLVTEQPTPENAAWGSLVGSVDIWSAHVGDVWKDLESKHPLRDIPKRIAAGDQVWTYTALVQAPQEWKSEHLNGTLLKAGHPPVWLTDYPAMNYRLLGWLAPLHGITGLTYWDTSHWPDGHDVWADNNTYPHDSAAYNGDGFLIYPAHHEQQGHEGPVASIRLKWIRESMDDHDYIQMMHDRGFVNTATDVTKTFARGFGDWDDNVPALYEAREQLGNALEKLNSKPSLSRQ